MAGYNLTRTVEEVLEHFEKDDKNLPSFTVHLHPDYWTLNNGSKFLYNNPVASLLDDIRAHRIPVDFLELFDSAKVPFYDGCMIVELLDYRPQKLKDPVPEKPERTRVVLHPNSETLWADICLLNQKTGNQWTDQDTLEIEARLLLATAPPLCLDPDPHLTRIVNNVLRVSTPTVPVSLKRKASVLDPEEEETDKARRAKLMQFMNPRQHRSHAPNYRILEHIQRIKMGISGRPPSASPQPPSQTASAASPAAPPIPPPVTVAIPSAEQVQQQMQMTKKNPGSYYPNEIKSSPSGSTTPAPVSYYKPHLQQQQQPNAHTSPPPAASPMQPTRAAVPTQQQYPQPTQVPSQSAQPIRPSPTQHPQGTSPVPNFQGPAPQSNIQQRSVQPKPGPANVPTVQGTPQQANAQQQQQVPAQSPSHAQMQQMYPYQMHMQTAANQRLAPGQNQNGRTTPQGQPARNPMNANTPTPQRGSPLVSNRGLRSRSPMPTAPAAPQIAQHMNYHPAVPQSPYNLPHLRPMPNNQHLSSHMTNGAPQAGGPSPMSQGQQMQQTQDQQAHAAQMMPQYQAMYNYAQNYGMQSGRLPPGYGWSMGRGGPVNNQMPGIAPNGHPQQMLNVGKAVQGGMQGR